MSTDYDRTLFDAAEHERRGEYRAALACLSIARQLAESEAEAARVNAWVVEIQRKVDGTERGER